MQTMEHNGELRRTTEYNGIQWKQWNTTEYNGIQRKQQVTTGNNCLLEKS